LVTEGTGVDELFGVTGEFDVDEWLGVAGTFDVDELLFDAVSCGFDELLGVDAGVLPETGLAIQISLRS